MMNKEDNKEEMKQQPEPKQQKPVYSSSLDFSKAVEKALKTPKLPKPKKE